MEYERQQAQREYDYRAQQDAWSRQFQQDQQNWQRQIYNDQQARLAPYRAASQQALGRLSDLIGLNDGQPASMGWLSPSKVGQTPSTLGDLVRR